MSILKEFTNKHNGDYTEEQLKKVYTTEGLFTSKIEKCKIQFDFGLLFIYLNDSSNGVLRLRVKLNERSKSKLQIYPRSFFGKVFAFIFSNMNSSVPDFIYKKYKFTGSKELLKNLFNDYDLMQKLNDDMVGIYFSEDYRVLNLTPFNGFSEVSDLERFISVLSSVSEGIAIVSTYRTNTREPIS